MPTSKSRKRNDAVRPMPPARPQADREPTWPFRRSDIKHRVKLSATACMEAHVSVDGGPVEHALGLCSALRSGIDRDAPGGETEIGMRLSWRADGFVPRDRDAFDRLETEALLAELTSLAMTEEGARSVWDAVEFLSSWRESGDELPDRRVTCLLLTVAHALPSGTFEPDRKARLPSDEAQAGAVAAEREAEARRRKERPSFEEAMAALRRRGTLRPAPESVAAPLRKPTVPGKVALRLLAHLHAGAFLREYHGHQVGTLDSRVFAVDPVFGKPSCDGSWTIEDAHERPGLKDYSLDRLRELESAGWVEPLTGFSPYLYCLTGRGREEALRVFGPSDVILLASEDADPECRGVDIGEAGEFGYEAPTPT